MANSLNVDLDYFTHPKTLRLVGLLGSGAEVLPIKLWAYCGKYHAEHGAMVGYGVSEIESVIGWTGKAGDAVAALVKVRYLDQVEGGYAVHDWIEYQGHIHAYKVRGKAAAMKKWKLAADAVSNASSNASSIHGTESPKDPRNTKGICDASSNPTSNAASNAVSITASNALASVHSVRSDPVLSKAHTTDADALAGHDPFGSISPGNNGSEDPQRKDDARRLGEAITFSKNWITVNCVNHIKQYRALADLILEVGKDRAVTEVESVLASNPNVKNPFAYAKPQAIEKVKSHISIPPPRRLATDTTFDHNGE